MMQSVSTDRVCATPAGNDALTPQATSQNNNVAVPNTIIHIRESEQKLVAGTYSCFGCVQTRVLVMLVALFNFALEAFFTRLTLDFGDKNLLCTLAFTAVGSLLCLCAVISGIQEEKRKWLSATVLWVAFKLMLLLVLYIVATTYFFEAFLDGTTENISLTPNSVVMYVTLHVSALTLSWQWVLTKRVVKLLRDRDEFYVIPSGDKASADLRASLKLYFAAQKLKKYEQF